MLAGKVAWVTGAGSGIGRATAVALAAQGAAVVLTGRRPEKLAATAALIGGLASVQAADVTDAAAVGVVATQIRAAFGRLDIVVNNAGMNVPRRALADLDPGTIDRVLGANLNSAFYVAVAALPLMREGGGGVFVHVGSRAGRYWDGQSGAGYTAAKAALMAFSHTVNREEFRHGIRSTVLCPGETATEILLARGAGMPEEELARLLRAEDCADLIRYVACLPPHVCMNEVVLTPAWNRTFLGTQVLPPRLSPQ